MISVAEKAKVEKGNAIYILTTEDYLKLKDLKNKNEARRYIKNELAPCANYLYHSTDKDGKDTTEKRLLEAVEKIRISIAKRLFYFF